MMRNIGRRESDSSPVSSLKNSCPARMPLNMRMVDPEFPQSSAPLGACNVAPRPSITTDPLLRCHFTPKARRHPRVLAQSAPVEKFSSLVVPSAIAPIMAYRCEMDLSPGRRMDPEIVFAGRIRTDFPCDICFSTITELDCPGAVVRSLITPPSAASFASFAKVDSAHRQIECPRPRCGDFAKLFSWIELPR